LIACGRHNVAVDDVASLRGLKVHAKQAQATATELWPWLDQIRAKVAGGERIAVRCACRGVATGAPCHCIMICARIEQQLRREEAEATGPPEDPVASPPSPAHGLNLEAAKPSKWHLGGAAIWIGGGLSATWMVTWVPQHKAAHLLQMIH
jgi:hypothetical protein